jgi:hypothetical protein
MDLIDAYMELPYSPPPLPDNILEHSGTLDSLLICVCATGAMLIYRLYFEIMFVHFYEDEE